MAAMLLLGFSDMMRNHGRGAIRAEGAAGSRFFKFSRRIWDMTAEQIAALIMDHMPEADPVRVEGGDGVHFSALVVSGAFSGLRPVQRHQRVYAALGELMGGEIHALALETLTPEEWAARCPVG